METNFIDHVNLYVKSGAGGAGSVHFRREKFVPKGGPDGGDGGRGGHIILRGNKQLWTLLHLRYRKHIRAENGKPGEGSHKSGKSGGDVVLEVPVGTVAKDSQTHETMLEILDDRQEGILLRGGWGGHGNSHYKTPTHQAPRYAQPGGKATEKELTLELKLLADVGLVGFPNAGKSTLLSVLSAAKPEIACYPFTTLTPNLGVIPCRDHKSFVMADIPGIIEGASEGKGLGIRFLRHIERNSLLLFLIPADSEDIRKEYEILLAELEQHNPELLNKDRMLAVSKSDLVDAELIEEMKSELPEVPYIFISGLARQGLLELKDTLWQRLNQTA